MPKTYSWREMWTGLKDVPKVVLTVGGKRLAMKPERALAMVRAEHPNHEVQWGVVGDRRAEAFRIDATEKARQGYRERERISIRCPFSGK